MKNLYLLIKCDYEGIEKIIFPSDDPNKIINELKSIRSKITLAKERRNKLSDDEHKHHEMWSNLAENNEIDWETYYIGEYDKEEQYCILKWDGNEFKCYCKELNVNLSDEIWFY